MIDSTHKRTPRSALIASALVAGTAALPAHAVLYNYVDWTTANANSAAGTITLPDSSTVSVGFAALNADGSPANALSPAAQTAGGTNYWNPSAPYLSAEVDNAPPDSDIIRLTGGTDARYVVSLSEPIKDPIMAIVSLGQPGLEVLYDFDAPFTIVSQGVGFWGGGANALTQQAGDVLSGFEGHGTIQFIGTFSEFSWTVPTPEFWHGFTFGIRTTEALEPNDPDPNGVPEPVTTALVALGLAGFGRASRRRV